MSSIISPDALVALEDALSSIYWYKNDLHRYIEECVSNRELLATLDWGQTKREIVSALVRRMSKRLDYYKDDLLQLIYCTSEFSDFSHLNKQEDSEKLIKEAKSCVHKLKTLSSEYFKQQQEMEHLKRQKEAYEDSLKERAGFQNKLAHLKEQFNELTRMENAQTRGYAFEKFLNEIFTLYDLQPRKSFKIYGQQIDGAFTHEGTDYLLEARWKSELSDIGELLQFEGKVGMKLKNTLGLFIAHLGFSESASKITTQSHSLILMDGMDLIQVLEGKIRLDELILAKRRHASQEGEAMYRIPL